MSIIKPEASPMPTTAVVLIMPAMKPTSPVK
jgi:hypothetical protein